MSAAKEQQLRERREHSQGRDHSPPPYPGHHDSLPGRNPNKSSSSLPKPTPPPTNQDLNTPLPSYSEPSVPSQFQPPLSHKGDRQHSLEPGESSVKSEPNQDSSRSKRKSSAGGSRSDEKKPKVSSRSGGLFSSSPERKSSAPSQPLISHLLSPFILPTCQGKMTRTASTSSNGEAMVNVQKLEHIAVEFQEFKGTHGPASILVGLDGQPSLSNVSEDPFPVPTPSNGSSVAPHQPWTLPEGCPSNAHISQASVTISPATPVKKEFVSPVKSGSGSGSGSGHKKEREGCGETHTDSQSKEKKRSSSGHYRSDKHSSVPASTTQVKDKAHPAVSLSSSDPASPTHSQADSPAKQQVAVAAAAQEISPTWRGEGKKRKHKDKKDDKHKKKIDKKDKEEKKEGDDKTKVSHNKNHFHYIVTCCRTVCARPRRSPRNVTRTRRGTIARCRVVT